VCTLCGLSVCRRARLCVPALGNDALSCSADVVPHNTGGARLCGAVGHCLSGIFFCVLPRHVVARATADYLVFSPPTATQWSIPRFAGVSWLVLYCGEQEPAPRPWCSFGLKDFLAWGAGGPALFFVCSIKKNEPLNLDFVTPCSNCVERFLG
jgi:hypothetical protein